jgi:hypothetical protein
MLSLTEVREKIRSAPSFPLLEQAAKSFNKRLYGKAAWQERWGLSRYDTEPENLLTAHSGVWSAKSTTATKLLSLALAVINEAGLPKGSKGLYRPSLSDLDWSQIDRDK